MSLALVSESDSRAKTWLQRAESCWSSFSNIRSYYQALAEVFYPERRDFLTKESWGVERYELIYDSEPIRLRWELANALGAMMRPQGREWFKLIAVRSEDNQDLDSATELDQEDRQIAGWLEYATKRQRDLMYRRRANFSLAMAQADNDYVTFGSAIVRRGLTADGKSLLFSCVHPRDIVWEEGPEGRPDTTYEKIEKPANYWKSVLKESCPPEILRVANNHEEQEKKFSLWRVIVPADRHEWKVKPPRDAEFASLYLFRDGVERIVAENWLRAMPYHIRRWTVVSGEPAGRSPCTSIALADTRTLNEAQRALLEGLEKAVDPPMAASDKIVGNEIVLRAGGIVYVEDVDDVRRAIAPIQDGARLDYGMEFARERRAALSRAFLQNVLKLPQDRSMTAYEVSERLDEFLRSASPVFEPMEADNSELCEGIFSLLLHDFNNRAGAFPPAPEGLQGADVLFDFETPLVDAQRKQQVSKVRELHAIVSEIMTVYPGASKHVHWDKAMEIILSTFPTALRKSNDEVGADMEEEELIQGGQRTIEAISRLPPDLVRNGIDALTQTDGSEFTPDLQAAQQQLLSA